MGKVVGKMEMRRYYGQIRVDTSFKASNLPLQNIKNLNEKISNAVEEWSQEMAEKGLTVDVGWNWSEHTNII